MSVRAPIDASALPGSRVEAMRAWRMITLPERIEGLAHATTPMAIGGFLPVASSSASTKIEAS